MHPQLDSPQLIQHARRMLESYTRWTGRELIPASTPLRMSALVLFQQPFVVLSHGTQDDPILNFGNRAALELWEMSWEEFTATPSRITAEPVNREERALVLEQVRKNGFTDSYRGVRISKAGRRFLVEQATVWNILDEKDLYAGQAATFSRWKYL